MQHISLSDLNKYIKEALSKNLAPGYWVVAEIGELRENNKGHCYLDLVEKEDNKIIAKNRATIWSYLYRNIKGKFEQYTQQSLKSGMEVLLNVEVRHHEVYGLSINVKDIDPNFTLGARAKRRQEIINRLTEEGLMALNKALTLPVVPKNIAIISSPSAAGYGDFINQIDGNNYEYKFNHQLFTAVMQGEQATESLLQAMERIENMHTHFDITIIIRGGGAQLDLDCFDTYELAEKIARFPLPVITGIGHERDDTIADQVAHTKMKTPTAVAEFLINGMLNYEEKLDALWEKLQSLTSVYIEEQKNHVNQLHHKLSLLAQQKMHKESSRIDQLKNQIHFLSYQKFTDARHYLSQLQTSIERNSKLLMKDQWSKLGQFERSVEQLKPENTLKRGFTLTYVNGTLLKNAGKLNEGDEITSETDEKVYKSIYQSENPKQKN